MYRRRRVLVVAATRSLSSCLLKWLEETRAEVEFARTYAAASAHLDNDPDMLITELELGDYNGLQLAIRANGRHIPTIVIGREDIVLERDAAAVDAFFIRKSQLGPEQLMFAIDAAVSRTDRSADACGVEFEWNPIAAIRPATMIEMRSQYSASSM